MKIFKTLVPAEDGLFSCDTIEYEGKLWLVPEWFDETPKKGYSRPVRIICMETLEHSAPFGENDYVLKDPIPKAVLDGHVPQGLENKYIVIENPAEIFYTPDGL